MIAQKFIRNGLLENSGGKFRKISMITDKYEASTENVCKQFRVSIDGNIASGKSTVLNILKRYPDTITIQEPIDIWRKVSNHNLLKLLYDDLVGRNFLFENYVQLCRLKLQTEKQPFHVQFLERSLQNNRYVFTEASYRDKLLEDTEYVVLCKWYDWISKNMDISLDLIVYLQCSPEVAHQRLLKRGRAEEKSKVTLDYMKKLHDAYEMWLVDQTVQNQMPPVLVINSEISIPEMEELCEKARYILLGKQKLTKPVTPIEIAVEE